jgi:predicted deacetylase
MRCAERGSVCISVHDVAPATWTRCAQLLSMLDERGAGPVTLLVVPDFHRRGRIDAHPEFVRAIERRVARGDEVALHGFHHQDDASRPRGPLDWIERRVLTQSEGEFAALGADEARARLERGIALMDALGWPVRGFVAPAWLLGRGARVALSQLSSGSRLAYTTTRSGVYRLPDWAYTFSPSLVCTVRSAWRRSMSQALNAATFAVARRGSLLRLSLHPVDAEYAEVMAQWRGWIDRALRTHAPATKLQWVAAAARLEASPARR